MTPADQFGPWAVGLSTCERIARCRTLRAVARLMAGPRASALCDALACSEADPSHLDRALSALDRLASLDRRRILGSYHPVMVAPAPCNP
jgi:hypothetical protein